MTKKFDYFLVNVFFAAVWGLTSSLFAMTCFHDVKYVVLHVYINGTAHIYRLSPSSPAARLV